MNNTSESRPDHTRQRRQAVHTRRYPERAVIGFRSDYTPSVPTRKAPVQPKPVTAPAVAQPVVKKKPVAVTPQPTPELAKPIVKKAPVRHVPSLSSHEKEKALQRALKIAQKDLRKAKKDRAYYRRLSFMLLAGVIMLSTGYVGIDSILTNNRVKAEYSEPTTNGFTEIAEHDQSREGRDESEPPYDYLANYTVADNRPRALFIDKLGISARILPMGVNPDMSVQAPVNIFDSGWYTGSAVPGNEGAAFIDAHASGPTRQGLFGNLDLLVKGDIVKVEKGDGTMLSYRVVHTEIEPLAGLDMKKVLAPYGDVKNGLNMMTCAGSWIQNQSTFDKRVIVYTEQI